MKTLSNNEIKMVSGGVSNAEIQAQVRETSYDYSVLIGYCLGATVGAAVVSSLVIPLSVYAGVGSSAVGLSAAIGGLGGGNLVSTVSSLLWKYDHS